MKKTRILFTIPNFDTAGSGKALLNIAKGLDASIYDPHIMCLHNRGSFFREVEKSGIPIHIYPYIGRSRPLWSLFKDARKTASAFKSLAPQIIHSFNYSADYTEAFAARLAGIPWVFTKKNMSWSGPSGNAWKLRSYLAKKIAIQNTDMKSLFYPKSGKTVLIPRGVNTDDFCGGAVEKEIFESMNTPLHSKVLLCVANFVPVKGIELLIEAFSNLKDDFPNWNLWLVGDHQNTYGVQLQQQVQDFHVSKRVSFSGKQLDVRPYLRAAQLFVLPTKDEGRREGSQVALLEAMSVGVCVLGSRVPGIKDQLINFKNHLFEPGDVSSLQNTLAVFMQLDDATLSEKGRLFSTYVQRNHDINNEIDKHHQLYQEILK